MGAYTTLIPDTDDYRQIVETIRAGYTGADGALHRPAPHMAACIVAQCNLGCRIGDIVHLTLHSFVRDGGGYRLDIVEQKTGKARNYPVPAAVYAYIADYCQQNNIGPDRRIFQFTTRAIQKAIKAAREYLGLDRISTHSFRKYAIRQVYDHSGHDAEVAREYAQHASVETTQAYIKCAPDRLEKAIADSVNLL